MITFSLRPTSGSILPLVAASVRTRVVSWKEAADKKESVVKEALVIPKMILVQVAGSKPLEMSSSLTVSNSLMSTSEPAKKLELPCFLKK